MNNKETFFIAGASAITAIVCVRLFNQYRARRRFRKGLEEAVRHASIIFEKYEEKERRKNAGSNESSVS